MQRKFVYILALIAALMVTTGVAGPLLNGLIARTVVGSAALSEEFHFRLLAIYNLSFLVPVVIVLLYKEKRLHDTVFYSVAGGALIGLQLSLFFDTSWNTAEISALRWFQSLFLIFCSLAALVNVFSLHLFDHNVKNRLKWFWSLTCAAFLFFAFDERFHLHEKVAEGIGRLAGSNAASIDGLFGVPYFDALVMILYVFAGLVLLLYFFPVLKREYIGNSREAYRYILVAVGCGVLSVVIDTDIVHFEKMEDIEELLEYISSTCFLLGFSLNIVEFADRNTVVRQMKQVYEEAVRPCDME